MPSGYAAGVLPVLSWRDQPQHPMPADFPPWQTVYDVLDGWQESGATEAMHDELRRQCRVAAGRKPGPTAAIIDSQSVRAAETVGKASRGYDAGKKDLGVLRNGYPVSLPSASRVCGCCRRPVCRYGGGRSVPVGSGCRAQGLGVRWRGVLAGRVSAVAVPGEVWSCGGQVCWGDW